jgi:hypothetical protein
MLMSTSPQHSCWQRFICLSIPVNRMARLKGNTG